MEEQLTLRRVTKADLPAVAAYRRAFLESGDSMDGTSNLSAYADMEAWFDFTERSADRVNRRADWVPDVQYLCIRETDEKLVGMLDLRDELNEICEQYYGHMGYSVHPEERRKGYAARMVAMALDICRAQGIRRVLITCVRENIASAATIRKNGGVLENEVFDPGDGSLTQRYWIQL